MSVLTVTGPAELDEHGVILPHEHLVIDYRQKTGASGPVPLALEEECVAVLADARAAGVQAIVDCTPPGYGRDLAFLRAVSERSGVAVIASTGTFCEQWSPQPEWVRAADTEELAGRFVAELGRSCGVIKVATSAEPTPGDLDGLRAAAVAHRRTGAPIVSHTTGGFGLEQLDLFAAAGVDLGKVLVSHVCADDEPVDYALAIARRGAYVGLDRIGHAAHPDEHWIGILRRLLQEGLGDRVLVSHDSVQHFTGPDAIAGHTFSNLRHLTTTFTQLAIASGIERHELHRMTVSNPRAWLAPNRVAQ
ncbi:phosphotriesterase family protein [Agromyces aerolatus]|uniref:phosphotriesterase family protein n=1 Tax=Agromyces sp. LY-1074 TaxID=3074080 RepID=UPI00285F5DC8|nr:MULTISPECIES: hypothetical protein [unclassified Agromyces]MDR5699558.1 hypothetical protein [Agromyces sp. LY-1074]MDR5705854.1 hypothetical protein [Agromyces sp. LY-1358]